MTWAYFEQDITLWSLWCVCLFLRRIPFLGATPHPFHLHFCTFAALPFIRGDPPPPRGCLNPTFPPGPASSVDPPLTNPDSTPFLTAPASTLHTSASSSLSLCCSAAVIAKYCLCLPTTGQCFRREDQASHPRVLQQRTPTLFSINAPN